MGLVLGEGPSFNTQAVYVLTSSLAASVTSNPVSHLQSLAPSSVSKGASDFQLTLNGGGFTEGSVVKWNRSALQTTFVASTVLTASVPAAKVATSGTASITVTNPSPRGGISNTVLFKNQP
jgi:hypothetical protein